MMAEMGPNPDETSSIVERLRSGDRAALGGCSSATATGSGGWSSCASTPGSGPGSTPRTSSRRRSSTSPATSTPTSPTPKLPPLLWLRLHVGRRLTTLHRQHLGTKMRDAGLEISLYREALPEASSAALASMLLGRHHLADPGGPAGRAAPAGPGGAQRPRPDRPRGPRAAALRAARPRRGGPGARDHAGGRRRSGTSAP